MDFLEEYKGAQDQLAIPTILGSVQTWTPPLGLVYELNFDAAIFANINASGFGAIICNDKGEVMVALGKKLRCSRSNAPSSHMRGGPHAWVALY